MSTNMITKLPPGWAVTTIGVVVEEKVSQSGPAVSDSFTYVDISSIDNQTKRITDTKTILIADAPSRAKQVLATGDVLVSMTRPNLNAVALVPPDLNLAIGSTGFDVLRAKGAEPSWLYYTVQSNKFIHAMCELVQGALYPAVRPHDIRSYSLPLPPLNEQRRIVAKIEELFSELDAGVAALQRVRANLKRYRASVLQAAVTGKLTEAWRAKHRDVEPASELLRRILAERRRKWEQEQLAKFAAASKTPPKGWQSKYVEPTTPDTTGLPELPAGWCWASVEQLGDVQLGRQRSPQNRSDKYPTKYIRAANITENGLALDDILDMDFSPTEKETYRLHPGDLVLSEASGSPDQVGKPAVWNGEIEDCCFQNTVIRLRPYQLSTSYTLTVLRHFYFNKLFARTAAGVGINHLSAAKFSMMPFPLAPLAEQDEISRDADRRLSILTATDALIETNLKRAARLRQSILKRAFEGKLVPQDPSDEPADKLLERIQQQRAGTMNGTGKRTRRAKPVSESKQEK